MSNKPSKSTKTPKVTTKKTAKYSKLRVKQTKRNRNARVTKWSARVLAVLVAISYVLGIGALFSTGIVPARYLMLLIPIGLVVVILVVWALLRTHKLATPRPRWRAIGLGALSVCIVLASGYVYSVSRTTSQFISSLENTSQASTGTVITKPYIVYISGIDTYGDVSTVSRSDVNIIAVVNPTTKKVLLVNTPRDYYVQLHGTTGVRDKLTHAGIYGVDMSKNTLQDLYGTPIDYTLRINFTSLLKVVDAVGGVDVISDQAFKAGGYSFVQGVNTLNSKQALAFARERHSFSDGDRQRGKDQQRVIEALITKLSQPSVLVNYQQILASLNGTFQTNASSSEVTGIIRQQLDSIGGWTTESISVDGTGATNITYSTGKQPLYVMEPDVATVNAAKAKIQAYLQ